MGVHAVLPHGAHRLGKNLGVAYEFKLPDLGEGLTEGEIARWLVAEGQEIAEDDPLVEVQTDKTTVEIPSPAAGKVARILVAEGDVVPVGTVLVVIGEDGAAPAVVDEQPRAEPRAGGRRAAPREPAATRARDAADPADGAGARRRPRAGRGQRARRAGSPRTTCAARAPAEASDRRAGASRSRGVRRAGRRAHGRAHREVPPVTWVEECDFSNVDLKRLVPTVLKAVAESLQEFPELNARLEGDAIVYLDRYDLGVAVQTEQGLVVPVVRACEAKSLDELADEVARLAEAARAGTLKPEELRDSTFTVTSAGKLGGLLTTPIVNHPEVAILSIGRVAERPVVRDGEIQARPIGTIAITFDHRVVDGARAAEFGLAVIDRLQA